MDHLFTLILVFFAFLLAGTIKGAVGMGLPTTAVGLMTLMIQPRLAIALILIPMLAANGWQAFRSGDLRGATRRYLPFIAALVLGAGLTVVLSRDAPDGALFATLGIAILAFVLVNATKWAPVIPAPLDRPAQIVAGALSGVMGGLTSVWAPPMAVYLAARHTPKAEFVRASGLLIFCGSLPMAAGYIFQGYLSAQTALLSTLLLVPTLAGFALGERLRHGLSEEAFRKLLLAVFFLMGLNLLRRAFM